MGLFPAPLHPVWPRALLLATGLPPALLMATGHGIEAVADLPPVASSEPLECGRSKRKYTRGGHKKLKLVGPVGPYHGGSPCSTSGDLLCVCVRKALSLVVCSPLPLRVALCPRSCYTLGLLLGGSNP